MRLAVAASMAAVGVLLVLGCEKQDAPFAAQGGETWTIDGREYRLSSTHYERAPSNAVAYVMTYPVPTANASTTINESRAATLALPLIRYAYAHRTFEREHLSPLGGTTPPPILLAVNLFSWTGNRFLYRYTVTAP
jgi:hypothetical protein